MTCNPEQLKWLIEGAERTAASRARKRHEGRCRQRLFDRRSARRSAPLPAEQQQAALAKTTAGARSTEIGTSASIAVEPRRAMTLCCTAKSPNSATFTGLINGLALPESIDSAP
jgi:hypothetical protein